MRNVIKAIALAAAVLAATPAYAMSHFLIAQWLQNGNNMCQYSNGTVLNVGARICPLRIQG
jgi:hypothetical protein